MTQILWFRRDLRIEDNAILSNARDKVLPIFIFDKNILKVLPKKDRRVTFMYKSVLEFKKKLQSINLDLLIFYDEPINVFKSLKSKGFNEVLCSIDFDSYGKRRDEEISKVLLLRRFIDSFILNPNNHLKSDGTPYKVFTPFYNSLKILISSNSLETFQRNKKLEKIAFNYSFIPTLNEIGFEEQKLPSFLKMDAFTLLNKFRTKITNYKEDRNFFYKNASSNISVHLRFGLISPKEIFNFFKSIENLESSFFIREIFWREFYNYILFHFPYTEEKNFNNLKIQWNQNDEDFEKWCEGKTGVPIIDAAMIHLNKTGTMNNRLRMIVASFLTKNLFIDWRKGEKYFALKLFDYEASSNIGSWQWSAGTGADASPYFRVFNPYLQSKKFDKDAIFIKNVFPKFKNIDSRLFHIENAIFSTLFVNYPKSIVNISYSRQESIKKFKKAKYEYT